MSVEYKNNSSGASDRFTRMKESVKNHVSIVELADEYFGVKKVGKHYRITDGSTVDGDLSSVIIYPETNTYWRPSRGTGGDVIKFVIESGIEGITSFKDAVGFLGKRIDPNFTVSQNNSKSVSIENKSKSRIDKIKECGERLKKNFKEDDNQRQTIGYLLNKRGIDKDIVYNEIKKGRIKQAISPNGQPVCAFIGYFGGNLMQTVSYRGISFGSKFKGDMSGCNYEIGWRIKPEDNTLHSDSRLFCFEGYIDMLSYMTLMKQSGHDYSHDFFICCGSVSKAHCIVDFAKNIDGYGEDKLWKNDVYICFDNDEAGQIHSDKIIEDLKKIGLDESKLHKHISNEKDWNDELLKKNTNTKQYTNYNGRSNQRSIKSRGM